MRKTLRAELIQDEKRKWREKRRRNRQRMYSEMQTQNNGFQRNVENKARETREERKQRGVKEEFQFKYSM